MATGRHQAQLVLCGSGLIGGDDHDIFGICVVEAARLCAAAEPRQILVADLVSRLVRNLGYRFGPTREFSLKGMAEPVHACLIPAFRAAAYSEIQRHYQIGFLLPGRASSCNRLLSRLEIRQ